MSADPFAEDGPVFRDIAEMLHYRRRVESKRHPRIHDGHPNACDDCADAATQALEFVRSALKETASSELSLDGPR